MGSWSSENLHLAIVATKEKAKGGRMKIGKGGNEKEKRKGTGVKWFCHSIVLGQEEVDFFLRQNPKKTCSLATNNVLL